MTDEESRSLVAIHYNLDLALVQLDHLKAALIACGHALDHSSDYAKIYTSVLYERILYILPECFVCPDCGPMVLVDEDGCCSACGQDTDIRPTREVISVFGTV